MEMQVNTEVKLLRLFVGVMSGLAITAISGLMMFVFTISSTSAGQDVRIVDNEENILVLSSDIKDIGEKVDETNEKIGTMNRELGEMKARSEAVQNSIQTTQAQIVRMLGKIQDNTD